MSYHLRLIKGLSFSGIVKATAKNPDVYVNDEATANQAVATGYFELVDSIPDGETESSPEPIPEPEEEENLGYGGKTLGEMNKSELETFATYRDVNIKGAKTKAEIIAKLEAALDPSELEGKIYYGSPTIQELQKE
ncbi:MAG: hypothetical protein K6G83_01925 [Lachnospiraceae bacterium]|nr:hypothetical protein [Lachnospiraceae bacterium]